MPIVVARATIFSALVVLSVNAQAASIISNFEYHSFWTDVLPIVVMGVVAIIAQWKVRKRVRQQIAVAPRHPLRNSHESRLHRLSLLLMVAPIVYAIGFEIDWLIPFGGMMLLQSAISIGWHALGLPTRWQPLIIFFAGLLSISLGSVAASWPTITLTPTGDQVWILVASAIFFT